MKNLLILFTILFTITGSISATSAILSPLKASEIFFPAGKNGKQISLMELSRITVKNYKELVGEKLTFLNKIGFKIFQKKVRNSINMDGTINMKLAEKYLKKTIDGQKEFHSGGFMLGFFSWFILIFGGILIAYLIKDDKKKNRVKWAWIGFASFTSLLAIVFLLLELGVLDAYF